VKLDPRHQIRNPVMFVVLVAALLATIDGMIAAATSGASAAVFPLVVSFWLWLTVFFANIAEAIAEGRGKAQAASLRATRSGVVAKVLSDPSDRSRIDRRPGSDLVRGDHVLCEAGDLVPADGEVVEGVASVNEAAITGESAPVIREAGGDRSSVVGGTTVLSDWIVVRVAVDPGGGFLDRMISLVEGAKRRKTPNEIALDILLAGLTLVFLLVCATLLPFAVFAAESGPHDGARPPSVTTLLALLVCLIPTTIGGLLSAIRIAGLDRLVRANVVATSGRAVEAAGDIDLLLLDKTGTITFGNRQAAAFLPAAGVDAARFAEAALLASIADDTPEGRSIVQFALRAGAAQTDRATVGGVIVPFSAEHRMSGIDLSGRVLRKGAADAIERHLAHRSVQMPVEVRRAVDLVARRGSTPLVVAESFGDAPPSALGVVELKDVVKPGIAERFAELRAMGITTIMVTGDNPVTAAAIAAEAGVDDVLAQATPERKLELIRSHQRQGRLVAMTGDGTNDAPALAQADVAVAMNSGTQAAKEAGNMVDLDSDPTKLIDIVRIGKQLLMTRGALTTFSTANDVAKYFAIIPAAFAATAPELRALDVMRLDPSTAIVSAVVFNALVIVALVPLALRGVRPRALGASDLLRRNLLVYGLGGLLVPFAGIKAIDLVLSSALALAVSMKG
jgi:K+-transporting ATPase ATPase B chain